MKVSAFAAIFNQQKQMLCVKRNYGSRTWTTPGGGVESGESPIQAVEREVYEETGYSIETGHLIGVYSAPFMDDYVFLFTAKVVGKEKWQPNSEIAEIGFFGVEELPQPMHSRTATRIRDAFENRTGVLRVFDPD